MLPGPTLTCSHRAGARLVEKGSWRTAPTDFYIVGLKELPENDNSPLVHRHIFFGHCFKYQFGWKELLQRFTVGGGSLLDMEFLNDEKGTQPRGRLRVPCRDVSRTEPAD